jgi:hypothetical protein
MYKKLCICRKVELRICFDVDIVDLDIELNSIPKRTCIEKGSIQNLLFG